MIVGEEIKPNAETKIEADTPADPLPSSRQFNNKADVSSS